MKRKADYFVKEIEELKKVEKQVKKARAAAKKVKVSVEKVPVKLRSLNPQLFSSSFFGIPELNELKVLEMEAKQLRTFVQKNAKKGVGIAPVKVMKRGWVKGTPLSLDVAEKGELGRWESEVRRMKGMVKKSANARVSVSKVKVNSRVLPEYLFSQRPSLELPDKAQLKALEKLKVRNKVTVIRKGGVSSMFGKQVKIPAWWLNPTGVFKGILLLEEKVKGEDYSGAMDLYLELNRSLQSDTVLSVTEKKEVFNRLLSSYKAIRDVFFVPA
ncbi:MAG: hypothetical protein WC595_05170 [Candidatus Nanoarchaeia archaeon]